MSQYYFLVASLPALIPDAPPPMSRQQLLALCEAQMSASDYPMVREAGLDAEGRPAHSSDVLLRWNRWEVSLRNALARLRALQLERDSEPYLREIEESLEAADVAREAFGSDDPMEAERLLARARWSFLEELEVGHYFDTAKLIIYALKLQMLIRLASMTEERGKTEFARIGEAVRAKIHGGETDG